MERNGVFSAALTSGALGATVAVNFVFHCTPEQRPLQFLLRTTIAACIAQFLYARVLSRSVIYDRAQKKQQKSQTKGGRFGEILGVVARVCTWYVAGVFVFHFAAVVFGAPLFSNFYGTFLWAALMSALSFLPVGIVTGSNAPEWIFQDTFVLSLSFHNLVFLSAFFTFAVPNTFAPQQCSVASERAKWFVGLPALTTIVGAWAGAIVIPLDWHQPWQQWPIPCTYGALAGYFIGVMLLFTLSALIPKHQRVSPGSKVSELVHRQRLVEDQQQNVHQLQQQQLQQQQQQQQVHKRKSKH